MRNGKVLSALPELDTDHPLQRRERAASLLLILKSLPVMPGQVDTTPSTDQELADNEPTLLRSKPAMPSQVSTQPSTDQELADEEQTIVRSRLNIGLVKPESARTYAFLDIQQNEQVVQRIAIKEHQVVVGRSDPKGGTTPEIDLTPFDTARSVSRQHARIRFENIRCSIEDLKSRNKTRLGKLTLTPLQPEVLQNGDVIRFGMIEATFRLLGTSELPAPFSPS